MYERLPIYVCARMNTRVQSCVSEKAGVTSTLPACRNGSHTFNVATVSPVLTFKKEEKREKNKNLLCTVYFTCLETQPPLVPLLKP